MSAMYCKTCGQDSTQACKTAVAEIRRYLQFDSQREVSWHEVNDCIAAVERALAAKGGKP